VIDGRFRVEVSMSGVPSPETVYERSQEEGRRRLSMPLVEQVATGFIAGVTIVFGIIALGATEALVEPDLGPGVATVAGALAFGIGVVFLVVGRSELFSENFFDPVAAAIDAHTRAAWARLVRLWFATFVFNLVGGGLIVMLVTVDGAVPDGAAASLVRVAEEIAARSWEATLVRAVLAGALITLLSYMLSSCNTVTAQIAVAFSVGFFLALGPFDHVIVSALHLLFGIWEADTVQPADLWRNMALATTGNMGGGLFLITLTHTAQVKGGRRAT
jgi:formate/nitrite transporter FocA (FNT family)